MENIRGFGAAIEEENDSEKMRMMVFTIDGKYFAANIDEVSEIIQATAVTPLQRTMANIEGVFKLRDAVVTVIDLAKYFGYKPSTNTEHDIFLVSKSDGKEFAYRVHAVVGMVAVDPTSIKVTDTVAYGGIDGVSTGVVEVYGKLAAILNFELILNDLKAKKVKVPEDLK